MTTDKTKNVFRVSAEDLKKIPGNPIAYWVSEKAKQTFMEGIPLYKVGTPRAGMITGNNALFVRYFFEVSVSKIGFGYSDRTIALMSQKKWFPYQKGGPFRKYYGNNEHIVLWENDGFILRTTKDYRGIIPAHAFNDEYIFHHNVNWSAISSSKFSTRITDKGFLFDASGSASFPENINDVYFLSSFLNSPVAYILIQAMNPTVNFQAWEIGCLPIIKRDDIISVKIIKNTTFLRIISKNDWDSYETSWDFQTNPLLTVGNRLNSGGNQFDLSAIYIALRRDWQRQTEEMRRLEIENNRIFIDAYGLQDELSPEVPWNEITLTCNPWYRYGKSPEEISVSSEQWTVDSGKMPKDSLLEARLLEDTIKEFISYAVGCMMGRYSPEKPGLILANQGEDIDRYKEILIDKNTCIDQAIAEKVLYSESTTILTAPFYPVHECCGHRIHEIADRDGVIPILDEEWFVDDIVAQFKQFLRFTFGEEHFADNLDFIEKALGKDLRKYFIKDFYKDHVQRYKKRPIYWMFSSPKGSFNVLIYMHRYRPDTVSIVLNEYLREFISKIRAKREHLIGDNNRTTLSPAEKTRNLKQIDKYAAMLTELDAYERDILYPLAQEKIAIDLDDGVKVNYVKFGAALKKIPGLEAKEE